MNEHLKPIRLGGIFDTPTSRHQAGAIWDKDEISPTIDTMQGGWRQPLIIENKEKNMEKIKIRKLTPSECYKLMGFTAEDCQKAYDGGISKTQLYKTAGNSIVVDVLEAIYQKLGEIYEEFKPSSN